MSGKRFTFQEVADSLGVTYRTVWRWAEEGYCGHILKTTRIGKKRYVYEQAIAEFLRAINEPQEARA